MSAWMTMALLWIGASFMLLAAVGIVRLPDTFTRMQAATKAVTLGVSAILLATATHFGEVGVTVRALTTAAFLFATAPVAAHVVGRVAYLAGIELWSGTGADDLRASYDRDRSGPESPAAPEAPRAAHTEGD